VVQVGTSNGGPWSNNVSIASGATLYLRLSGTAAGGGDMWASTAWGINDAGTVPNCSDLPVSQVTTNFSDQVISVTVPALAAATYDLNVRAHSPQTGCGGQSANILVLTDGVTVTGAVAPVAVNDSATVNEDSGANTINVRANDTNAGAASITAVTQPTNGAVAITNAGEDLTYQPAADYCNDGTPTDDFTYTLTGGSSATVSVTVTCADNPPVAEDDSATVTEDDSATSIDVLANDSDPDAGRPGLGAAATERQS
jgi:VCBS repeat-containing protein